MTHGDFEPTSIETGGRAGPGRVGFVRHLLQRLAVLGRGTRDRQTALYSRRGLLTQGERLVMRAGRKSALAIFDFHDLLEVPGIFGQEVGSVLQDAVVERMLRLAGRHGLAARTGPAQFAVLLPGTPRQGALDATVRVFGKPCRLEMDLDGDELVLVPEVTVDTCEAEAGAVGALYQRLSVHLATQRDLDERRRNWLRRSRERHSRPAPLGAVRPMREFAAS